MTPVLHVSQRFPASRLCAAPVLRSARHPRIDNRVIVFDLAQDPEPCCGCRQRDRRSSVHAGSRSARRRATNRAQGSPPQPLPGIGGLGSSARGGFRAPAHRPAAGAAPCDGYAQPVPRWRKRYARCSPTNAHRGPVDADASLYDGFIGDGDKRVFSEVRATPPEALGLEFSASAIRVCRSCCSAIARATGRRRCRSAKAARWNDYRRLRLHDERGLSEYSFEGFRAEIAALRLAHAEDGGKQHCWTNSRPGVARSRPAWRSIAANDGE